MIGIINIYDRRDVQSSEIQEIKINGIRVMLPGGVPMVGDGFNTHSRRWDPRCNQQHDSTVWGEIIHCSSPFTESVPHLRELTSSFAESVKNYNKKGCHRELTLREAARLQSPAELIQVRCRRQLHDCSLQVFQSKSRVHTSLPWPRWWCAVHIYWTFCYAIRYFQSRTKHKISSTVAKSQSNTPSSQYTRRSLSGY
jgi:hypothetical protein